MIRLSIPTIAFAVLLSAGSVTHSASAQKPNRTPTNWPCVVTMRDNPADAIQSDSKGPYANGVGGVTCVVVPPDSGSLTAGDLSLYFTKKITRALFYAEQLGGVYPGYEASYDTGSIRVKDIASVVPGDSVPRAFIAYGPGGRYLASNEGDGDQVTDLVSVRALDACTWEITMDANDVAPNGQARMELWEGPEWSDFRGILQMPFGLTAHVTGVKAGCSQ